MLELFILIALMPQEYDCAYMYVEGVLVEIGIPYSRDKLWFVTKQHLRKGQYQMWVCFVRKPKLKKIVRNLIREGDVKVRVFGQVTSSFIDGIWRIKWIYVDKIEML